MHGLVAHAWLWTPVIVVLIVVSYLFVCGVPLVPASQMFCHHSFLNVLADLLVAARNWPVPGRSQSGVWVVRHAVHFIVTIVSVHVAVVISCRGWVVGGIDVVVTLHLIFVHVKSVRVRIWFCIAWIACDIVGSCGWMTPRLVGIAAGVCLSQVGHTARVGVYVFSLAAAAPASVVAGGAVLNAGLASVGRAVIKDLGAVAALGWS